MDWWPTCLVERQFSPGHTQKQFARIASELLFGLLTRVWQFCLSQIFFSRHFWHEFFQFCQFLQFWSFPGESFFVHYPLRICQSSCKMLGQCGVNHQSLEFQDFKKFGQSWMSSNIDFLTHYVVPKCFWRLEIASILEAIDSVDVDGGTAVTRMTGGLDPTLAGIGLFPDECGGPACGLLTYSANALPRRATRKFWTAALLLSFTPASFSVVQNTSDEKSWAKLARTENSDNLWIRNEMKTCAHL